MPFGLTDYKSLLFINQIYINCISVLLYNDIKK